MTCCWSVSWRPPFHPTCSGGSRATCTDGLPPASTDRPGLAFDLSGQVSLRAQSFPLASLTSSFPTTPTLQTSIVPMQTTSHPFSLTTIFLPPLSACPIMGGTPVGGRPRPPGLRQQINCTLFTSDTHQSRLDPSVSCNGNTFQLCRSPKLLGVTFDTHFTFSPHIRGVAERARSRLGILKALAGVSWGQSKEVLLLTYQMLIKPILSYAAPVWFPNAPTTAVSTLQSIQNSALRIATDSLKMASTDHLHQEASVLPVRAHLSMLCSQFLLSALRPNHPSNPTVTADSGPRNIRHTLQSRFRPSISAHLIDGITQPDSYRESLRRVHSDAVAVVVCCCCCFSHLRRLRMSLSIADAAAGCSTSSAISDPSWCLLLSPTRASQSIHKCSAVSSPMLHNLQSGDSSLPTRTSHRLRAGWCPVLKRVRSTLSLLDSVSSSFSLISPRYTCLSRGCPTSSPAISLLIRACRVALSSGTSLCSIPPPSAANLSASSLPGTLQWPGIQTIVTVFPVSCSLHNASRMLPTPGPPLRPSNACTSALLSVATRARFQSSVSSNHSIALLIAIPSAA